MGHINEFRASSLSDIAKQEILDAAVSMQLARKLKNEREYHEISVQLYRETKLFTEPTLNNLKLQSCHCDRCKPEAYVAFPLKTLEKWMKALP